MDVPGDANTVEFAEKTHMNIGATRPGALNFRGVRMRSLLFGGDGRKRLYSWTVGCEVNSKP